jgi:hypothetical protein
MMAASSEENQMRALIVACILFLGSLTAASAQQSVSNGQLVGTWNLVRWWNIADDGHEMPPPIDGQNIKGSLMLDAQGHYALVIASERPKWKSPDRMEGTPEENTAAARGALAYFGTYMVNEADHTFTLHVDGSLHPNIVGSDQKRFFSISGDEMKSNTQQFKYPKGTFTGYFTWVRAK